MNPEVKIKDVAIWFKDIHSPILNTRFNELKAGQEITLETDGVVGRWQRMRTGRDGRETMAIRPMGTMKIIWNEWFKSRKGELIEVREVKMADDYLESVSSLFSEWSMAEDEDAFRDL